MRLLALDTATAACSVALYDHGEVVLSHYELSPCQQSRLLLPMVDKILAKASLRLQDLDALAVTVGPGSFIGLRIAISVVQALMLACELPVVSLSTLQAIAQRAYREHGVTRACVALNAYSHTVYWGGYQISPVLMDQPDQQAFMQSICADRVVQVGDVETLNQSIDLFDALDQVTLIGDGWQRYNASWASSSIGSKLKALKTLENSYPHAMDVALLGVAAYQAGKTQRLEQLQPIYLRDDIVTIRQRRA